MKPDERAFLVALSFEPAHGRTPRAVAASLGIAPKRAAYLCHKWAGKGWYDYGVSVDMGWLEPAGYDAARGVRL